jgi:hypothetical protein
MEIRVQRRLRHSGCGGPLRSLAAGGAQGTQHRCGSPIREHSLMALYGVTCYSRNHACVLPVTNQPASMQVNGSKPIHADS